MARGLSLPGLATGRRSYWTSSPLSTTLPPGISSGSLGTASQMASIKRTRRASLPTARECMWPVTRVRTSRQTSSPFPTMPSPVLRSGLPGMTAPATAVTAWQPCRPAPTDRSCTLLASAMAREPARTTRRSPTTQRLATRTGWPGMTARQRASTCPHLWAFLRAAMQST